MVHQFPELTETYKLRGIHLQEQARLDLKNNLNQTVRGYKNKGFSVTSSFHSKNAIANCNTDFEYVLLSPVFGSISKAGYEGKGFDVRELDAVVVGMGGINEHTLQATIDLGYKGVGVLGGIWNSDNPMESFGSIRDKANMIVQS